MLLEVLGAEAGIMRKELMFERLLYSRYHVGYLHILSHINFPANPNFQLILCGSKLFQTPSPNKYTFLIIHQLPKTMSPFS